MSKAVIFDMDGVIVDTEPLKFEAYKQVFSDVFGVTIEEDSDRWGKHEKEAMQVYLRKHQLSGDVADLVKKKNENYYKILKAGRAKLFPGVVELLGQLREQGFKIGLATSSNAVMTSMIFPSNGLDTYFDIVLTQEDVEKKKPDPEIYLKSAEKLGLDPKLCIVVEDSPAGIQAAQAAGMKCIGIASGVSKGLISKADLVLDSFEQLTILNINNLLTK